MAKPDTLADALTSIKNSDAVSRKECIIRPASKVLGEVLRVMQKHSYISTYELVDDGRQGIYKVELLGKINECSAVKPRYAVKKDEFEKYEKRYLPSRDVGMLIVTTPKGIMTHNDAKEKNLGGRLVAYIY